MWDVPGGHVEKGETPEECIVREMEEEMGMQLEEFHLFSTTEFDDRIEYTFWKRDDLDIEKLELTASATIGTAFMHFFGKDTITVSAYAEVTRQQVALDLVLSIDMSGSMGSSMSTGLQRKS